MSFVLHRARSTTKHTFLSTPKRTDMEDTLELKWDWNYLDGVRSTAPELC